MLFTGFSLLLNRKGGSTIVNYVIRILIAIIPLLLFISFVSFAIIYFLPGDPAAAMLGEAASPEQVEALRHQLGLDQPFHIQFINWFENLLRGDLGESIHSGRPVVDLIKPKIAVTF